MDFALPGLKDLVALLEQVPGWKRLAVAPARIDELEKRVAGLEARLDMPTRSPGKECPFCGAHAMRLTGERPDPMFGELGVKMETWTCGECGKSREEQGK